MYLWMRGVGIKNVRMEVIDTLPKGATRRDLVILEAEYAVFLRAMKGDMVNMVQPRRMRGRSPLPPVAPSAPKPLPPHLAVGFWSSPLERPASSPREPWTLGQQRSNVNPFVSPTWPPPYQPGGTP